MFQAITEKFTPAMLLVELMFKEYSLVQCFKELMSTSSVLLLIQVDSRFSASTNSVLVVSERAG